MKNISIFVFLLFFQFGFSQDTSAFFAKADAFFKNHVVEGRVDYKKIKKDPAALDELLGLAKDIKVATSDAETYQSFYINAYNISVIKGIVNAFPVKSPMDIKGFFDKTAYNLGGKEVTLNDLENVLLRKNYPKEPRFHFVLVCAGLGCPPIINAAYTPELLEQQLQEQAVKALNSPEFIRVKGKKVQISQIFEWYKGDFTKSGSEIEYINQFRKEKISTKAKVSYYPYDWTLNQIKK